MYLCQGIYLCNNTIKYDVFTFSHIHVLKAQCVHGTNSYTTVLIKAATDDQQLSAIGFSELACDVLHRCGIRQVLNVRRTC